MNKLFFLYKPALAVVLLFFSNMGHAQEVHPLWDQYPIYKESAISGLFFKHGDIVPLIQKRENSKLFKHEILGSSVKGRSIHHLTLGQGKTKILLWSQMHGDETTATRTLFDLFNFFEANDKNNGLRKLLLDKLELHFIPMLNPDGAEVYKRRNNLDIDINRDARLLNTPEGRILMKAAKDINPNFGFNLHDQGDIYAAGPSRNTATISFLAPAFNIQKDMNETRKAATQVILMMNNSLQKYIPGKVAKYGDDYDPRCFGDTFSGMGISSILIESGSYPGDEGKEFIRKLNFYAILTALEAIAKQSYRNLDLKLYDAVPENSRSFYDLLIRNVKIDKEGHTFNTNLGINRSEIRTSDFRGVNFKSSIDELGDVNLMFGHDEADAGKLKYVPAKIKNMTRSEWEALRPEDELNLVKEGYLFAKWSDGKSPQGPVKNRILNLTNLDSVKFQAAGLGQPADFILAENDKPVFAVINGFLIDLAKPAKPLPNSFGY